MEKGLHLRARIGLVLSKTSERDVLSVNGEKRAHDALARALSVRASKMGSMRTIYFWNRAPKNHTKMPIAATFAPISNAFSGF